MEYTIANYIAIVIYLGLGFLIGLLVGKRRSKAQHRELMAELNHTISAKMKAAIDQLLK